MNYIAPGLRELGRIFDRQFRRFRLVTVEQRKLAQLESHLGLLGWQQADFGAETQHHIDHLAGLERRQAELTNESASLGLTLQQLEERRASERATFESHRNELNAARDPLVPPVQQSEKDLAAKQKEFKEAQDRFTAIEREQTTGEERYRELLAKGNHTQKEEAEVQNLRTRVMLLPHEAHESHQKLTAVQAEVSRVETELEQRRAVLAVETTALQTLEKDFAASDRALAEEIAKSNRNKQKLERQINDLEKTKTQPYREIGKVLADQGIEPANQPEALTAVLAQREHIAGEHVKIIASRHASHQENRIEVVGSWSLLFTIVVVVWGVLWFILK